MTNNSNFNFRAAVSSSIYYMNDIDNTNIIDGGYRIYYNYSISGYTFDDTSAPNAGTILCGNCTDIIVRNFNLSHHTPNNLRFFNLTDSLIQHIISSNSNDNGIHINYGSNNTFINITANTNGNAGLYIEDSHNNSFTNMTLRNNIFAGVESYDSFNHTLINLTIENGGYGIYLNGISNNNRLENITINGTSSNSLDLLYVNKSIFKNIAITNSSDYAVYMETSSHNNFSNILAQLSLANTFSLQDDVSVNLFSNITIRSNGEDGLIFNTAHDNNFSNLTIHSNGGRGIFIDHSSQNNTFTNSTINNNTGCGVFFRNISTIGIPKDNIFYNNIFNNTCNYAVFSNETHYKNFFNTTEIAVTNIWGGASIGGNYWAYPNGSGFSETCNDAGSDGFCDLSYNLSGNDLDYLPLTTTGQVDSVNPAVTIISPTAITYTVNSVLLNITATDASGVDTCWGTIDSGATNTTLSNPSGDFYNATLSSISNGDYVAIFYCNDTVNNLNSTENVSFTVTVSAGDPGSPGGGGGSSSSTTTTTTTTTTTSTTTENETFETVLEGVPAIMALENENIDITEIEITTSATVSGASVSVSVSSNPSGGSSGLPSGSAYQTFTIDVVGFDDRNLEKVSIDFKVDKAWMISQEGASSQISLFRQKDGETEWESLNTILVSDDADYYYFTAVSPGFSTFSIFLSDIDCISGDRRCVENFVQLCLANQGWKVSEECGYGCQEGKCSEKGLFASIGDFFSRIFSGLGNVALYIVIGIAGLGVIVLAYFLIRKRIRSGPKPKKQKPKKAKKKESVFARKKREKKTVQSLLEDYSEKYARDR